MVKKFALFIICTFRRNVSLQTAEWVSYEPGRTRRSDGAKKLVRSYWKRTRTRKLMRVFEMSDSVSEFYYPGELSGAKILKWSIYSNPVQAWTTATFSCVLVCDGHSVFLMFYLVLWL